LYLRNALRIEWARSIDKTQFVAQISLEQEILIAFDFRPTIAILPFTPRRPPGLAGIFYFRAVSHA
jgi:hypothetical protein